jgi:hypothetical protein
MTSGRDEAEFQRRAEAGARLGEGIVATVYIVSAILPASRLDSLPVLCSMRRMWGLPCPGCGMTHAFVALSHGDLGAALHYNAMALPLYVGGLAWLLLRLYERVSGRKVALPARLTSALIVCYAVALIAFGVYRIAIPAARPY